MITLESTELAQAHQYFAFTRGRLVDATTGLSEAQWRFKPAPDRWSIQEILEHLAIVHERVFARIRQELPNGRTRPDAFNSQQVDAVVMQKIPDRSITAKAPDFIAPTGVLSPSESLERIFHSYERLSDYLESTPDLRDHVLESPPLRVVTNGEHTLSDGYQWALTLAGHDERHVRQIEEVKADPKYPA
ncbi:MAG TPA: DinB family protein [Terriglobales bacterium]|nr:DinB family protein [Terriglobales bacterium]